MNGKGVLQHGLGEFCMGDTYPALTARIGGLTAVFKHFAAEPALLLYNLNLVSPGSQYISGCQSGNARTYNYITIHNFLTGTSKNHLFVSLSEIIARTIGVFRMCAFKNDSF